MIFLLLVMWYRWWEKTECYLHSQRCTKAWLFHFLVAWGHHGGMQLYSLFYFVRERDYGVNWTSKLGGVMAGKPKDDAYAYSKHHVLEPSATGWWYGVQRVCCNESWGIARTVRQRRWWNLSGWWSFKRVHWWRGLWYYSLLTGWYWKYIAEEWRMILGPEKWG